VGRWGVWEKGVWGGGRKGRERRNGVYGMKNIRYKIYACMVR
jgi:hypothetical protein